MNPVPPGLAADGIDELVMGFGGRIAARRLRVDPPMVCSGSMRSMPACAAGQAAQRAAVALTEPRTG